MIDINEKLLNREVDLTFIDPNLETILNLLPQGFIYRDRVDARCAREIPVQFFRSLQPNDILFIDSTHVSKIGSAVNYLVLNALPKVAPGVLIHFRDIPYPFEYSGAWIVKENRSCNEAYSLSAFLAFNRSFEVLFLITTQRANSPIASGK